MNWSRFFTLALLVLSLGCGGNNAGVNSPSAQNVLPTDNGILVLEVAALRASARTDAQLILAAVDQHLVQNLTGPCVQSLDSIERMGFSIFTRVLVSSDPVAVACARDWPMFECEGEDGDEPTCDVQTFPWGFAVVERPDADVPNRPSDAEILTLATRLALADTPENLWLYGYLSGDFARAMRDPSAPEDNDALNQQMNAWLDHGVNVELRYGPSGLVLSSEVTPDGQQVARALLQSAEAGVQEMLRNAEQAGATTMTAMLRMAVQQTTFLAQGNRVEIRSPLGLEQLTIVAGVGLPAFTSYVRRSKAAEALANLRALQAGVEAWSVSAAASAPQVRGQLSLPPIPAAPLSIATPGVNKQMGDYLAPAWNLYGFLPDGPTYYGYEVSVAGETVYLRAVGNLDGDQVPSLFVLRGERDPSTGRIIWHDIHIENELE